MRNRRSGGVIASVTASRVTGSTAERLRILESAIVNANDSVLITEAEPFDEPGPRIVYCNAAFIKCTGYSEEETVGRSPRFLQAPETNREELARLRAAMQAWRPITVELLNRKKNGSYFWVEVRIAPVPDETGKFTHWISIQREICRPGEFSVGNAGIGAPPVLEDRSDYVADEVAQLVYAASHDHLTNLHNRSTFISELDRTVALLTQTANCSFALLFIDLDQFKIVNDSLGHHAGDKLLMEIAYRLKICTLDRMIVARLGGDEFAVLTDVRSEVNQGIVVAERIVEAMRAPIWLDGQEVFCTLSIGIVEANSRDESSAEILKNADIAMYYSKRRQLGGYALYTEEMKYAAAETLRLHTDLKNALLRGEFFLVYQPIFHALTCRVVGVEALLRWKASQGNIINPADFIPAAEATGLIVEIGGWVLENACRQLKKWHQQFPEVSLFLSVNISGLQLKDSAFPDFLQDLLVENDLAPTWLQLEITESVLIDDLVGASTIVKKIRAMGIAIALDDFGTGFSSLSYLTKYEIDSIKIDKSFIQHLTEDFRTVVICESIIRIGGTLGMKVIAEGVEHKQQLTQLRQMTCDYVQGFLLSKPLSPQELQDALANGLRIW